MYRADVEVLGERANLDSSLLSSFRAFRADGLDVESRASGSRG